jgi:hypothetical protein
MNKKLLLAGLIGLALSMPLMAAKHINVLWLGNSLSGAGICDVGFYQMQWMVNGCISFCDTSKSPTGVVIQIGDAMAGATSIAGHWAAQRGLDKLADPTVRSAYTFGGQENYGIDHYDYMVMQGYALHSDAAIHNEAVAIGKYCDTMLTFGTKPVIFAIYEDSSLASYTKVMHMYDSMYNIYKDRGALIAPVYRAFKKVWDVVDPATLFAAGDVFEHENANGVYIYISTFYDLFTRQKSVNRDWAHNLQMCPALSAVAANHVLYEQKVDEAVAEYYTLYDSPGQTAVAAPIRSIVRIGSTQLSNLKNDLYDLSGRPYAGQSRRAGSSYAGLVVSRSKAKVIPISALRR